jgi:hypothetical protein
MTDQPPEMPWLHQMNAAPLYTRELFFSVDHS